MKLATGIDKNVTHSQPTSQQSLGQESASPDRSEDSDSPAEAPDPHTDQELYSDWTSSAGNQLENNLSDSRWQPVLESARPHCLSLADKFANILQIKNFSVSILWTDDAEMAQLNSQFRQKDGATNILSFPAFDSLPDGGPDSGLKPPVFLGDMALGFETLSREAGQNQRPVEHHLAHLFLHGLLHLAGFDHQEPAEAEQMETLEIQLLSEIDIPDPYHFASDEEGEINAHV